jgi:hypothetical protein
MSERLTTRRSLLKTGLAALGTGVAGCSGSGNRQPTSGTRPETTSSGSDTSETPTDARANTTTPGEFESVNDFLNAVASPDTYVKNVESMDPKDVPGNQTITWLAPEKMRQTLSDDAYGTIMEYIPKNLTFPTSYIGLESADAIRYKVRDPTNTWLADYDSEGGVIEDSLTSNGFPSSGEHAGWTLFTGTIEDGDVAFGLKDNRLIFTFGPPYKDADPTEIVSYAIDVREGEAQPYPEDSTVRGTRVARADEFIEHSERVQESEIIVVIPYYRSSSDENEHLKVLSMNFYSDDTWDRAATHIYDDGEVSDWKMEVERETVSEGDGWF